MALLIEVFGKTSEEGWTLSLSGALRCARLSCAQLAVNRREHGDDFTAERLEDDDRDHRNKGQDQGVLNQGLT